jgi:hypothetical protein
MKKKEIIEHLRKENAELKERMHLVSIPHPIYVEKSAILKDKIEKEHFTVIDFGATYDVVDRLKWDFGKPKEVVPMTRTEFFFKHPLFVIDNFAAFCNPSNGSEFPTSSKPKETPKLTIKEACRPNYDKGFALLFNGGVRVVTCKLDNKIDTYPTKREAKQAANLQLLRQLWRNNEGSRKGLYHVVLVVWAGFKIGEQEEEDTYHSPVVFNFKTEAARDLFWDKATELGLLNNELYKI